MSQTVELALGDLAIAYEGQARAYDDLATQFVLENRGKEAKLCRLLQIRMVRHTKSSQKYVELPVAQGRYKPKDVIDPSEMRATVEHMADIAQAMGDVEAFNLSPQELATRLVQLPLDEPEVTRLQVARINTVDDFLRKTERQLISSIYCFGERKLTHVLFVFARSGLYPQTLHPLEEHGLLFGVLSRLPWRQN